MQAVNAEFSSLDQSGRIIAEYIWIGGTGLDTRSKAYVRFLTVVAHLSA